MFAAKFLHWSYLALLLCIYEILPVPQLFSIAADVREYCLGESLNASCPEGSVVVMDAAWYGRMRIGRCVEMDLGHLGKNYK